jgi:hypothetical protein
MLSHMIVPLINLLISWAVYCGWCVSATADFNYAWYCKHLVIYKFAHTLLYYSLFIATFLSYNPRTDAVAEYMYF